MIHAKNGPCPFQRKFTLKIRAGFITGRTGSTFDATQKDLAASIGILTIIAMDAEVFGIVKSTFMISIRKAVCFDLFRYGSRVYTQVFGDIFKGIAFTQGILDVDTVFKGKELKIPGA